MRLAGTPTAERAVSSSTLPNSEQRQVVDRTQQASASCTSQTRRLAKRSTTPSMEEPQFSTPSTSRNTMRSGRPSWTRALLAAARFESKASVVTASGSMGGGGSGAREGCTRACLHIVGSPQRRRDIPSIRTTAAGPRTMMFAGGNGTGPSARRASTFPAAVSSQSWSRSWYTSLYSVPIQRCNAAMVLRLELQFLSSMLWISSMPPSAGTHRFTASILPFSAGPSGWQAASRQGSELPMPGCWQT
mmetsp:Transcript_9066/g.26703  ORF Transcript_9066/g.26703 Transcript_9066/m.26703 type:complete len:246 (+) Transcript_9066:387-1124(+)